MDELNALTCFQALSQDTRLAALRLLVRHEPDGLAAGKLAEQLKVPHNTLSSHLSVLSHAGLVEACRQGRSIIYRASIPRLNHLVDFVIEDCCHGHPDVCRRSDDDGPCSS